MAIQIGTRLKAQLLKTVIDQVTGGNAVLEDRTDSIKIILSEPQKNWIREFVDKQLEMRTKPDIEIDVLGILLPVVLKRIWPVVAAAGGIGALLLLLRRIRR